MKKVLCVGLVAAIVGTAHAGPTDVWLNELHYDNAGSDTGELVEIAIGSAITPSTVQVYLYNGSNGTYYNTLDVGVDLLIGQTQGDMTLYWMFLPSNGLQNGAPDGLAITVLGSVEQFLSYEGKLTATNGPAEGMTSEDIGISESSATPVGSSIGLTGSGNAYTDFAWTAFDVQSAGQVNHKQEFSSGGGGETYYIAQTGSSFVPNYVEAMTGDTIIWTWSSGDHTVTSGADCLGDGGFDSPLNAKNSTFEWVIPNDAASMVDYFCIPHCGWDMVGQIAVLDGAEPDSDGDGWPDSVDNCVDIPNPDQADCDEDGIGDVCDDDTVDCNSNGIPDACEWFDDCNENGVPDECDLADGTLHDDNNNGVPDECEFAPVALQLQEIRTDQPGGDDDEYFEIRGDAGLLLDGVYYIVIGDGSGGSGVVESITDLSGVVIPASGTLLVAEDNDTLGAVTDHVATLGFENSDNVTHFVCMNFYGFIQQDLDTDDDGNLDVEPWTDVLDGVRIIEDPSGGDLTYLVDEEIGPTPDGYVPSHVYRCTASAGYWMMGEFDPTDPEAVDTPGSENPACPVDCPADFDGDGSIGVSDILILIAGWGGNDPTHDLDGDGTVGVSDLLILIGAWGPC